MNRYIMAVFAVVVGVVTLANAADYTDREVRDPKKLAVKLEALDTRVEAVEGSEAGGALASGQILVGNSGGTSAAVTVTGDISMSNAGVATVVSANGDMAVGTNATVGGTLGVTGTTTMTGALVANGNTTLGNATTDVVKAYIVENSVSTNGIAAYQLYSSNGVVRIWGN